MKEFFLLVERSPVRPSVQWAVRLEPRCGAHLAVLLGDSLFSQLDVVIGRAWNAPSLHVVTGQNPDEASRL